MTIKFKVDSSTACKRVTLKKNLQDADGRGIVHSAHYYYHKTLLVYIQTARYVRRYGAMARPTSFVKYLHILDTHNSTTFFQ